MDHMVIMTFKGKIRLNFLLFLVFAVVLSTKSCQAIELDFPSGVPPHDGPANYAEGKTLFQESRYEEAAMHFWRALLMQEQNKEAYPVDVVFQEFLQCFVLLGRVADGLTYVAQESISRGQYPMGKMYLSQALEMDPYHEEALILKKQLSAMGAFESESTDDDDEEAERKDESQGSDLMHETPEKLYEIASGHFASRNYESCADVFEISCQKSAERLFPSCSNAVYCRNMIIDWGFNGTQFEKDMKRIEKISRSEVAQYRRETPDGSFNWLRAMSTHPHMMLGYPVDPILKRYVAESAAFVEDISQRVIDQGQIAPLPSDLPFDPQDDRIRFVSEVAEEDSKIRIGFVSSGFNSKAVLYLSHDMFRFFDKSQFEVHIFSLGPPDNALFIKHAMRGVDWRERVKANVDFFHDVQEYKSNHIGLARYIHNEKIHILMEWDGYARQGERAQGLFALRPAPIQIWHQEYLGTSGAKFVDYLFTDEITSPKHLEYLYVEKLIYLPNHFFSKGHAVQKEVRIPTIDYEEKTIPYRPGTGNPKTNRCLARNGEGPETPSIVFCNYNKFLKNNPNTIKSWIRILREVPDAMLCLLDNPKTGVAYLRKFIHEAAGTSNGNADEDSFVHGDGDELNSRIYFLPWENNPFDHQMRTQDFCDVMLDSW
jgi:protein O-GlcNAc transferase